MPGRVLLGAAEAGAASVSLWPDEVPGSDAANDFRPYLTPFLVEGKTVRGAVVVCPGGGYGGRAEHEGAPIAEALNKADIHAFVLQYRVAPHRHPAPLLDAARAVRTVRSRAAEWRVNPDHVAILGFSAGGHLTASLGVHYDDATQLSPDAVDAVSARPDALVLCYPVITSGEYGHQGSFRNLLGPDASDAMLEYMSIERHVNEKTPPTFLWHTANDGGVPVKNSLLFAEALSKHRVPFELHVYPEGRHGLGLAAEDEHVATWMPLCCQWLHGMGW
ncbi:MAG TPA: alpha/beta hydrolase [Candidatus Hydrogenedentes bacterium]|nr:alpha/beta hydrolase [Candidatus Hydrogenedentota bacterium]